MSCFRRSVNHLRHLTLFQIPICNPNLQPSNYTLRQKYNTEPKLKIFSSKILFTSFHLNNQTESWRRILSSCCFCLILILKVFFNVKNIFIMKNLTDFHKMVETGVDPCLRTAKRQLHGQHVLFDYFVELNNPLSAKPADEHALLKMELP